MSKWINRLWSFWMVDIFKSSKDSYEAIVVIISVILATAGLIGFSLKIGPYHIAQIMLCVGNQTPSSRETSNLQLIERQQQGS